MDAMTMNAMLVELLTFKMQNDFREARSDARINLEATFQRDTDVSDVELMHWFMNEFEVKPSEVSIFKKRVLVNYTNDSESTGLKSISSDVDWRYLQELAESFMKQINCISERVGEILVFDAYVGESNFLDEMDIDQSMEDYLNRNMPVVVNGDFSTFGTHFELGGVMRLGSGEPVLVTNPKGHSVFDTDGELVDWINE